MIKQAIAAAVALAFATAVFAQAPKDSSRTPSGPTPDAQPMKKDADTRAETNVTPKAKKKSGKSKSSKKGKSSKSGMSKGDMSKDGMKNDEKKEDGKK